LLSLSVQGPDLLDDPSARDPLVGDNLHPEGGHQDAPLLVDLPPKGEADAPGPLPPVLTTSVVPGEVVTLTVLSLGASEILQSLAD